MAEHSSIEWTEATWNPITGCTLVSDGCRHCYAARLAATRLKNHPSRKGLARMNAAGEAKFTGEVRLNEQWLDQPLRWKRGRMIFVCAHGDLFHESVPDEWIDRVFAVMALTPHHTYQVLTKRSARMRAYLDRKERMALDRGGGEDGFSTRIRIKLAAMIESRKHEGETEAASWVADAMRIWPLPNVWLGVSAERQQEADERIPDLLATPAAVRFLSAEPLLGPIDLGVAATGGASLALSPSTSAPAVPCLDWVIVGGESGEGARPMHPAWARSLRDQCAAAGVSFFFKQWGAWSAFYDRDVEDPDWRSTPKVDGQMGLGATRFLNLAGGSGFHGERLVAVRNVGKKAAGRLLDGLEHSAMPGARR